MYSVVQAPIKQGINQFIWSKYRLRLFRILECKQTAAYKLVKLVKEKLPSC